METSASIDGECNAISRVTSRDTWPPAWLVPKDKPKAEPATEPAVQLDALKLEPDGERNSLAWEAALAPEDADGRLAAALAEFEPVRFEPLLTPEQARERLDAMVSEADEWIERIGADGRRGWDRPGQLVNTRWWETTSLDELPTWSDALCSSQPPLPNQTQGNSTHKPKVGIRTRAPNDKSNGLTSPTQRSLEF
jgi:hypothetical protein